MGNNLMLGGRGGVRGGEMMSLASDLVSWSISPLSVSDSIPQCLTPLSLSSTGGPAGELYPGAVPSAESHGRSTLRKITVCGSLLGRITVRPGDGWHEES